MLYETAVAIFPRDGSVLKRLIFGTRSRHYYDRVRIRNRLVETLLFLLSTRGGLSLFDRPNIGFTIPAIVPDGTKLQFSHLARTQLNGTI